jgi:hypothetical protein
VRPSSPRREADLLAGEELAGALGGRETGIGILQGVPLELDTVEPKAPRTPAPGKTKVRARRGRRRTP